MTGKKNYGYMFFIGAYSLLIIFALINYNNLPYQIPINWNEIGLVNNSISKNLFIASLFVLLIAICLMFRTSKSKKGENSENSLILFTCLAVFLLTFIYIFIQPI